MINKVFTSLILVIFLLTFRAIFSRVSSFTNTSLRIQIEFTMTRTVWQTLQCNLNLIYFIKISWRSIKYQLTTVQKVVLPGPLCHSPSLSMVSCKCKFRQMYRILCQSNHLDNQLYQKDDKSMVLGEINF